MIYIKTKKEIDFIRESCKLVARLLKFLENSCQAGITTAELDKIAEDFILSNNAKSASKGYRAGGYRPYPANVCISVNEEVVHGIPGTRKIKDGDIVSIDASLIKDGYFGDSAITVMVGEVSPKVKSLVEETKKSLYLGIEQAIDGNKVGDISNAVQTYIESKGYSVVKALTGHGVGKFLHEDPQIPNYGKPGKGPKLKNGMTIAIEPMINIGTDDVVWSDDGWTVISADYSYSAHFEHTILINDDKPEILTIE